MNWPSAPTHFLHFLHCPIRPLCPIIPNRLPHPKPPPPDNHRSMTQHKDRYAMHHLVGINGAIAVLSPVWERIRASLEAAAEVYYLSDPDPTADSILASHLGLASGHRVVLGRGVAELSDLSSLDRKRWFREHEFATIELPEAIPFGGASDTAFDRTEPRLWLGYGPHTSLDAASLLEEEFDLDVFPLHLVTAVWPRLELAFGFLSDGTLLYVPDAFDETSRLLIEEHVPADRRISLLPDDAQEYAAAFLELDRKVTIGMVSDSLTSELENRGFTVERGDYSALRPLHAGPRSIVLHLTDGPVVAANHHRGSALPFVVVTLRDHILDKGLMARAFDVVTDNGGNFDVLSFKVGKRKDEASHLELRVEADDEKSLARIEGLLLNLGGVPQTEAGTPVSMVAVDISGVAPEGFYGTTIFPTDVFVGTEWIRVQKQRMDGVIVVDPEQKRAECKLIRNLHLGELVVVGHEGVRPHYPQAKGKKEGFAFMSGGASSERHAEATIENIAREMIKIRRERGKIVVVSGPVVIHTGGAPFLAKLVHDGYVSVFLGGNASAVHDIENDLYGTSLGVDLRRGKGVHGGHLHHITAINKVRRCGSIRAAVETGLVKSGIFYEIIKANVPFCLAGSIRDDGPLPDTMMDLEEAQMEHARLLEGARMILMLSSMLHSIGVGNMTPAGVKLICVDINPSVVTKLADRGSLDSVGVVTDVGLFLQSLSRKLDALGKG